MNAELLKAAGIDWDRGAKRFMGRTHLYEKVLSKFPKDTTFDRICAAYAANDVAQLLMDAHELKGVCGNIALTRLFDASEALVVLLRSDAYTQSELRAAFSRLEDAYQSTREAILAAMEESV